MTDDAIRQNMETLSACSLFAGMGPEEIRRLLAREGCRLVDYSAGSAIPSEGGMLLLLSGSVLIEKQAADGRCLRMREALPPQAINVSALMADQPPRVSRLSAPDGCRAVELPRQVVVDALTEGGRFSVNLMEFLLGQVVFLNRRITALSGHTAGSRLELYLAENAAVRDGQRLVQLPCSLSEFAQLQGVGRASLYRTLDAMEAEGRIRRKGRVIYLTEEL